VKYFVFLRFLDNGKVFLALFKKISAFLH